MSCEGVSFPHIFLTFTNDFTYANDVKYEWLEYIHTMKKFDLTDKYSSI